MSGLEDDYKEIINNYIIDFIQVSLEAVVTRKENVKQQSPFCD